MTDSQPTLEADDCFSGTCGRCKTCRAKATFPAVPPGCVDGTHTQIGPVFIVKQPQWSIACENCDWSTEHWDLKAAKTAARNHAEGCHE